MSLFGRSRPWPDGNININRKQIGWEAWIELIWLGIGTSDGILFTRLWWFRLYTKAIEPLIISATVWHSGRTLPHIDLRNNRPAVCRLMSVYPDETLTPLSEVCPRKMEIGIPPCGWNSRSMLRYVAPGDTGGSVCSTGRCSERAPPIGALR